MEGALVTGGGGGGHFVGAGGEAGRGGECVAIQAVRRRMEAEPGVTLWGVVGQIAELGCRESQGAEPFPVVSRWTSGRRKRLWGAAVTVQGVRGSAAAVVRRAERANLERRRAR